MRILLTLLLGSWLPGCAMVTSSHLPTGVPSRSTSAAYYFLPKADLHVQLKRAGNGVQLAYLDDMHLVPDESQLYVLNYNPSPLSDDSVDVQLGTNGLLQKIESSAEDKTGAIILKLVEAGKEAFKAAALVGGVGIGEGDFIFAPEDVEHVNQEVANLSRGASLRIEISPPVPQGAVSGVQECEGGVCFRPLVAHRVSFVANGVPVESHVILIPNGAPILSLPIRRAAFVKKVTNITFEDGILKEVHLEKPSEALGFMDIPVGIAKAISSVPGELLQLKVDYVKQDTALLQEQKNALDAAKALSDAKKGSTGADGSPNSPTPKP